MQDEYNPSEHTAARAALLWKRMLANPKFDNGDKGFTGIMAAGLAAMIPANTTADLLDAFEVKLREAILTPDERGYFEAGRLSVDYGPDHILDATAKAVGLKVEFPWKTSMSIHRDYLTVRGGYSAETLNHYRLPNGKWLVTSLYGSEIEKIKKFAMDGTVPTFTVED